MGGMSQPVGDSDTPADELHVKDYGNSKMPNRGVDRGAKTVLDDDSVQPVGEQNIKRIYKEKIKEKIDSAPTEPDDFDSGKNTSLGTLVNEAIALFLPILPGDFIGAKTAFAKPPTREAVSALLERYSLDELKDLINKYAAGKTDRYRPEAGTVYEFCTIKLSKIEAYVSKSAGGLWAHRSISTPEQSKVRDEQYQQVIDRGREEDRLAREKWEKEHQQQ
jgi:hypothetical protein